MTYSDILGNIKTVEQGREFSSEIDELLESLFKTQNNFQDSLNTISALDSQMIKENLLKNGLDTRDLSMIKKYLECLKEEIQKLKIINLTLTYSPSQNSIDAIFSWVAQNLGKGLVLDIKVDKAILGGAIIEFEGKYEDLSLRKRLDELFRVKREEIITN